MATAASNADDVWKNRDFWPNVSLYLRNDTRCGHSYYGTPIGTRMHSIKLWYFQWSSMTPNQDFKVTPSFDTTYLRKGTTERHCYNGVLLDLVVLLF